MFIHHRITIRLNSVSNIISNTEFPHSHAVWPVDDPKYYLVKKIIGYGSEIDVILSVAIHIST
jgi:hypothetical protein